MQQQQQQIQAENPHMTFDEVSLERSKSFMRALQELKNLKLQLYSAAEYCEKSYVHNEQKQMVLDNLKDYAVRALVNTVDHLGTVAYKLSDLFDQQVLDTITIDLKITSLDQRLQTCQIYTDTEGLRQQQFSVLVPRHHKHYVLPSAVNRKLQNNPQIKGETGPKYALGKPRPYGSGTPASKTLCWHLASETTDLSGSFASESSMPSTRSSGVFMLDGTATSIVGQVQVAVGRYDSHATQNAFGVVAKDQSETSKALVPYKSFGNADLRRIARAPSRSKSMISTLFGKISSKSKVSRIS